MRRLFLTVSLVVATAGCSEQAVEFGSYRPAYTNTCQDFGSAVDMASMFLTSCTEELNGLKKAATGASYSACDMATGEAQAAVQIRAALAVPEGKSIDQVCPAQSAQVGRLTRVMDWRAKHLDPYLQGNATSLPVFEPAAPAS